jgi:SAM-dependent methyltransferase
MLLQRTLPDDFRRWNRQWGAPWGRAARLVIPRPLRHLPVLASAAGRFALQPNNATRTIEYPWAFHAASVTPGMRVLELGGGLSGFQFVLDHYGCEVVNVDPGLDAHGVGWPVTPERIAALNRRFDARVTLENCFLEQAGLPDESFDRVFSISVLEHVPESELEGLLAAVRRVLKPGGLFVLTVDLFLDLAPFSERERNRWGNNLSIRRLIELSKLSIARGEPRELCGFDEFDPKAILERSDRWAVGNDRAAAQALVLRKDQANGDATTSRPS